MKTRLIAPALIASLSFGVLAACSSSDTPPAEAPTTVQVTDVPTSNAAPETSTSTVPVATLPVTTSSEPATPITAPPTLPG
jgi:hypothetical protein